MTQISNLLYVTFLDIDDYLLVKHIGYNVLVQVLTLQISFSIFTLLNLYSDY